MRKSLLLALGLGCLALFAQPIPGRYVVELTDEPVAALQASLLRREPGRRPASLSQAPEIAARRALIQAGQQRLARAVASRGGRVLGAVDTALNALFVRIDDSQAAALRQLPGVLRVTQERRHYARLDRVLALSKIPEAWQRIGGAENAGAKMRIAILDSGIDSEHPGFAPAGFAAPEGFPKSSSEANAKLTTNKVIVVRSYEALAAEDSGYGADGTDNNGHGTNAGCAAACIVHPINDNGFQIAGAAPAAFLGAYKVLGDSGSGSSAMILKGIEDAMKDGFDVLNLSLGSDLAIDPATDPEVKALNAAVDAGFIVAVAAGNAGPDENTINSPGVAENVMTVGSSSSDRAVTADGIKPIDPNQISGFSSRGPNLGSSLKPDLVAVGDNFLTAFSKHKSEIPYDLTEGTSFATPTVAGAAAVLKAGRPGLTASLYQSLLVNSASEIVLASGSPAPIRHQGAGRLDLVAAFTQPFAFAPVSVKFGIGGDSASFSRNIDILNVTDEPVTATVSVKSFDGRVVPSIDGATSGEVPAKGKVFFTLKFAGTSLEGEYHGVIIVKNNKNGVEGRIPYWYGARATARAITLLEAKSEGPAGDTSVFGARVVDGAGIDVPGATITVTTETPGAKVQEVSPVDGRPGVIGIAVQLAAGENVFKLTAGAVSRTVTITGQ